jgi:hypothetical protein
LGIPINHIEFGRIFSIDGVLKALKRCWLQTNNLDKLIFVHNNWPSDLRVGCLKPFDLVVICEVKFDLTNELDVKFMDEMEREEYVDADL